MGKVEALHQKPSKNQHSGKRRQHNVFTLICGHLAILSNLLICFKLIPVPMAIAEMKIDHFLQVFMAFRFFVLLAVAGVAILK